MLRCETTKNWWLPLLQCKGGLPSRKLTGNPREKENHLLESDCWTVAHCLWWIFCPGFTCLPLLSSKSCRGCTEFSTAVTWKSDKWVDLKTTLEKATPFVRSSPNGWHAPTCDRDEFAPTVANFGSWAYLEFRPYPVFQDFFPLLSDTASLLNDMSTLDLGLEVAGFVCSNIGAEDSRHYWLVECSQGRPQRHMIPWRVFKKSFSNCIGRYQSLAYFWLQEKARSQYLEPTIEILSRDVSLELRDKLSQFKLQLSDAKTQEFGISWQQYKIFLSRPVWVAQWSSFQSTSRKKICFLETPRAKADATKRIRERGATDQKVRVILDWCNSLERSSAKKQEVTPILSKEADAKVSSITVWQGLPSERC